MEPEGNPSGAQSGRIAALIVGPLLGLLVWLLPLPALSPRAHALAAIMSWVVAYWITEPIPLPVTALLGTALCVMVDLAPAKVIFTSYGHPIIFLFIGSFFLAQALTIHGVDRRFAAWMLSLTWVGASPARLLLALALITGSISMWISNTAATALMLPASLGLLGTFNQINAEALGHYRIALLLILSYAATAGGLATVIGTPPNLIGAALIEDGTGLTISFVTWMVIGLPLAALLLAVAWGFLHWNFKPGITTFPGLDRTLAEQRRALGPWTRGQKNACGAFLAALTLWIVPGLLGAALGPRHPLSLWLDQHLPNELVGILATVPLFFLRSGPDRREPTLTWRQASDISWGTILLFGGGLAFGDLMERTGLSGTLGQGVVDLFGVHQVWGLTAVIIATAVLVSELASNTASASMLVPVAIAIADSAGVSPIPPALGACMGASLGFALPVSTPPNAIVYGTGLIPIRSMIRLGLLFDVIGAVTIWLMLRLLCPLVGLA
jgi:sodium-dependent dicarboxylate transporter 2/3/5